MTLQHYRITPQDSSILKDAIPGHMVFPGNDHDQCHGFVYSIDPEQGKLEIMLFEPTECPVVAENIEVLDPVTPQVVAAMFEETLRNAPPAIQALWRDAFDL